MQLKGSYLSAVSPPLRSKIKDAYGSDDEEEGTGGTYGLRSSAITRMDRSGGRSKTPSSANKNTDLVRVVLAANSPYVGTTYSSSPVVSTAL